MFDYRLPSLSHSRLACELTMEDWQGLQVGDLIAFREEDKLSLPPSKYLVLRDRERDRDGNVWEICQVFAMPTPQRRAI